MYSEYNVVELDGGRKTAVARGVLGAHEGGVEEGDIGSEVRGEACRLEALARGRGLSAQDHLCRGIHTDGVDQRKVNCGSGGGPSAPV